VAWPARPAGSPTLAVNGPQVEGGLQVTEPSALRRRVSRGNMTTGQPRKSWSGRNGSRQAGRAIAQIWTFGIPGVDSLPNLRRALNRRSASLMRDTTTREVSALLQSVRGMSDSGLMTRARAAVGSAA
jgi:hypothetical protein